MAMISKFQSDDERTSMERAASALNSTADLLWILAYLLKNAPLVRGLCAVRSNATTTFWTI